MGKCRAVLRGECLRGWFQPYSSINPFVIPTGMFSWGYKLVDELIWVKTNQLQRIIRTGRCVGVGMFVYLGALVYVCMYVCMYACICVCVLYSQALHMSA